MVDSMDSPASPLSKLMHQHAQQQQQPPPPSPAAEYQRLSTGSSSSRRSSSYTPNQVPAPAGYSTPYSRGGLSTSSSAASRRQPPGGHCQWALA